MFTPIHLAAFRGNLTLMRLLRRHGADVFESAADGINMLHMATQGDSPVVIVNLLEKEMYVDMTDSNGRTPLHHAAIHGTEVAACYLLANGAKVNAQDNEGMTPLM